MKILYPSKEIVLNRNLIDKEGNLIKLSEAEYKNYVKDYIIGDYRIINNKV